jgi:hypothetical protein
MKINNIKTAWEILEEVKDPRNPSGKRYKLGSILKLIVSGFICGCNNIAEVLRWGQRISKNHLKELGFNEKLPRNSTLSNLFRQIDVEELEKVFNQWSPKGRKGEEGILHLALDGKTLRASAYNEQPAAHVLSLFSTALKRVFHQRRQKSADNEITTALELLKAVELKGVIITGDAMFAQKKSV